MKRIVIILTICLLTITSVTIYANNRNKNEQEKADYIILWAREADQLQKQVIEYLNRGYSLAGGPFYEEQYHQAVYKR